MSCGVGLRHSLDLELLWLWCIPAAAAPIQSGIVVAVAYAGSCSSDSTPSLGTSICWGCSPKKKQEIIKVGTNWSRVVNKKNSWERDMRTKQKEHQVGSQEPWVLRQIFAYEIRSFWVHLLPHIPWAKFLTFLQRVAKFSYQLKWSFIFWLL